MVKILFVIASAAALLASSLTLAPGLHAQAPTVVAGTTQEASIQALIKAFADA
jgi:hypothetical protein